MIFNYYTFQTSEEDEVYTQFMSTFEKIIFNKFLIQENHFTERLKYISPYIK